MTQDFALSHTHRRSDADELTGSLKGGCMALTRGRLLSASVGLPREFEYNGRPAKSAIWKTPVAGRFSPGSWARTSRRKASR